MLGDNRRRVVVTGMGAVTALGLNLRDTWDGLVRGRSGVGPITLFDTGSSITKVAAEVPKAFSDLSCSMIPKRSLRQMTRLDEFSLVCSRNAVEDSGISPDSMDKERAGVIIGASYGGYCSNEHYNKSNYIIRSMVNSFSAWTSLYFGLKGPSYTVNTACASSAYAIGLAFDLIKSGQADFAIAGGTESMISQEAIAGFNELMALSENNNPSNACRPFDRNRDGFVMGEGAGMLVLESLESALKRGARIYCEIAGYAFTSEAYNIFAPEKNGEGMARTMGLALNNAAVDCAKVGYINAHGTSTVLNDLYETMAIKKVFGERARKIPISSSKSMIGHTLGAAGAIEGIITAKAVCEGILPPTINYSEPDPDCDLDYVPNQSRKCAVDAAISNSFGFGGHNATIVFKKINY